MKLSTYASKVNAELKRNYKTIRTAGFFLCLCSCDVQHKVKNGKTLHEEFKKVVDQERIYSILLTMPWEDGNNEQFKKAAYKARIIYMKQLIAELKAKGN